VAALALLAASLGVLAAGPTSLAGASRGPAAEVAPAVGPAGAGPALASAARASADPSPGIIPEPGSGREPRDAGERGGWMQSTLFFLLCGAIVLIGLLVWRESRRARRRGGTRQGAPPRAAR
jgi:hypothetical protein